MLNSRIAIRRRGQQGECPDYLVAPKKYVICRRLLELAADQYRSGNCGSRCSGSHDFRFSGEDEFRIAELTHLWKVETSKFAFGGNAMSEEDIEHLVQGVAEAEDEADQG